MKTSIEKSVFYNTTGTTIYLFAQWLMTLLAVWLGNYEIAGNLSLALSISATFAVIASYSMRSFQSSDIDNKYSEKIYFKSRIITSTFSFFLILVYVFFKKFELYQVSCILIFMIYKISESILDVIQGSLQKKWHYDIIAKSLVGRALIIVSSFTLSMLIFKDLLISLCIMTLLIYVFLLVYEYKEYRKLCDVNKCINNDDNFVFALLKQCFPFVIYGFIINYVAMSPRVCLEEYYGTKILGYYGTIAAPAVIIQAMANMIYNPLIPVYAEYYKNKNRAIIKSIIKVIFILIAFCMISLILSYFLKDLFFKIIYGTEILSYTYLFYGIIIVTTLCAIVWFLNVLLVVFRKSRFILFSSIFALFLVIFITPIIVKKYAINGVNYTLYIVYGFLILLYLIVICKELLGFRKGDVLDVKNT